ncbi:hypothetical protein DYB32_005676 [Aphanomyces invadans]|uniref:Uncharacterized protein n=1 Tax=Aphanomyces invadans TaxID=157072 RepID=A0A3R6VW86_9STRA|nr:hypothetical protein DYB32_005676 [Aphanomyces invadans]
MHLLLSIATTFAALVSVLAQVPIPTAPLGFTYGNGYWNEQTEDMGQKQVTAKIESLAKSTFPSLTDAQWKDGMTGHGGTERDSDTRTEWKHACTRGISGTPQYLLNDVLINAEPTWTARMQSLLATNRVDPSFVKQNNIGRGCRSAAAIVLNTSTHLRSVGLAEKGKREMHALKYPNKDSVGVVMKHSTSNYVAVLTGTHYEIASGPGVSVAWHSHLLRFAVLMVRVSLAAIIRRLIPSMARVKPDEDEMAKRARAAVPTDSPRKKLGFFGKAEEVAVTGPVLSHFFKHEVDLRPHTVGLYDIDPTTGMCTRVVSMTTLQTRFE